MPDLAELEVWLKLQDDELKRGLADVDRRLDKFEKDSTRKISSAGEAFDGFGTAATRAGQALAPLSAAFAGVAGYSLKLAAEYQKMGNVFQAVSGASVSQMEAVRKKAVELGNDLKLPGTSAKDAMEVMLELSKAGLSVADTMSAARGSVMLAAAGQISGARAAEIQANAMNAFALRGKEAGRVADLLTKAANASSAGVEDLSQAFAMGSSSAYSAGLSIEEYTATLAAMANAGIKGSDSGTSVKSMLLSLTAPSKEAAGQMEAMGLSYFDAAGKARPFLDVMKDLRGELSIMTQQEQADVMKTIFGTDGVRAASIITRLGDSFDDLVGQMEGAQGSAAKMAESYNKGLLGAFDGLRSSVETLLLAEGDKGLPALEGIIRSLAEQVQKFGDLPDPMKNLILGLGGVTIVAGPALMAVGSMSTGIGTLMGGFSALTGAVGIGGAAAGAGTASGALAGFAGVLSNPVTIAIAAGVLAVGGLALAYNHVASEGERYAKQLETEIHKQHEASLAKFDHLQAVKPLIEEYDRLKVRVGANAKVSDEMRKVLDKIVLQAPELISSYDGSGRAVGIYADSVKRLGDEAAVTHGKLVAMARGAWESIAAAKQADLMQNRALQDRLRDQIAELSKKPALAASSAMRAMGDQDRIAKLTQLKQELAALIVKETSLQSELVALAATARAEAKKIFDGGKGGAKGPVLNPQQSAAMGELERLKQQNWKLSLPQRDQISLEKFGKLYAKLSSDQSKAIVDGIAKELGRAVSRGGNSGSGNNRPPRLPGELRPSLGEWAALDPFGGEVDFRAASGQQLTAEAVKIAEKARMAAIEAQRKLNEGFQNALSSLQNRAADMNLQIRSMFLDDRDRLALESFGKLYDKLTDPANRQAIDDLIRAQKELTEAQQAQATFNQMANFGGLERFTVPEEKIVRANFGSKSAAGNPLAWALPAIRIIEDINRSYDEYLENLANEGRLLTANTEAERIRLELSQQHKGWTEDMLQAATARTLEIESVRNWRDQVEEIVGGLTNWIEGALEGLYENGFKGFFTSTYQGFVRMIADMAKAWISSQIRSAIFNLVGGLLDSPMKGGDKNASNSQAYIKNSVAARAAGGPVRAGMPYLVGERGPELLVPQASGYVYSQGDTNRIVNAISQSQINSSSTSVQPIIINITIQANDPSAFVASERQIEQAVADAVRRGMRR